MEPITEQTFAHAEIFNFIDEAQAKYAVANEKYQLNDGFRLHMLGIQEFKEKLSPGISINLEYDLCNMIKDLPDGIRSLLKERISSYVSYH